MTGKETGKGSMEDYILRASAGDSQVRAFAATTRELVEYARAAHNTSPVATAALGRLLTAGAMMGIMMKGEKDLLTLKIEGDGPIGGITVTADSQARVKGYVNQPEVLLHANAKGKLDVSGAVGKGELVVIRDTGFKEPYVGRTNLVSGEIAEDLTYYFASSEQVPSAVALGVLMNRENTVRQAGGFIIQLLPDADEEIVAGLERKLAGIASVTSMLDQGMRPEDILNDILGAFGVEILERIPTRFFCDCTRKRVEKALISVGEKELNEMIREGKPIEVKCHFCNQAFWFQPEELESLLEQAR